jgi:hypothetical protein
VLDSGLAGIKAAKTGRAVAGSVGNDGGGIRDINLTLDQAPEKKHEELKAVTRGDVAT